MHIPSHTIVTKSIAAALLLLALTVGAAAQGTAAVTPQEFYGFALSYRALTSEIAKRRAAKAESADGLESAALAHYRVSREQFGQLAAVIGPMFARLRAVDEEAQAYVEKTGSGRPDVLVLSSLYAKRVAVLADACESAKRALPPGVWLSLSSYIKGHVSTIRRR